MALTFAVTNHWSDGKKIHVTGTLTASGNYATNGDTVDYSGTEVKSNSAPVYVNIQGRGDYTYKNILGSAKVKVVVTSTGVEVPAGAYPAGVTADVIDVYAIFKKFV